MPTTAQQKSVLTYESILSDYFAEDEPGAAVLVSKKGGIIYQAGIGLEEISTKKKTQANSTFRIASITKQFTAVAILKLAEEGKIDLDDSINKYISGLHENQNSVKIKHLLSHTAGVKNYTEVKDWDAQTSGPDMTVEKIIDVFTNEPLAFAPGEKHSYSNLGYFMLGYIVEVASGKPYGQYLSETFFKPLKMTHTGYEDQANPLLKRINGYSMQGGKYKKADYLDMKLAYGAGALVSTTDDLNKWNQAIFSHKVLNKPSLDLAHSKFTLNNGSKVPYGFGWEIGEVQGLKSIKHDGIINGFISFGLYLPEKDIFVAVLTNCDCTSHIEEVSSKLAAFAADDPYIINELNSSKSELLTYQGIYESSDGDREFIGYQEGRLYTYQQGGRKYPLAVVSNAQIVQLNNLAKLTFVHGSEGVSSSYTKQTFDYNTKWTKVSDEVITLERKEISENDFEKYTGKYQVKDAFTFEVYMKDGKMYGSVQGDDKEIKAYDADKFYTVDSDIKLDFRKDTNEKVSEVVLFLPMPMNAARIE